MKSGVGDINKTLDRDNNNDIHYEQQTVRGISDVN